jgi:exopolysaccharide production protein ExoQ
MLVLVSWSTTGAGGWQTTIAVLLFLAPWAWIVLRQPGDIIRSIITNWPIIALPTWALLSVIWSDYPSGSLKSGAELLATVTIGIWAGHCIKPRILTSALLSALMLTAVLGIVLATKDRGINGYIDGLVGLFGSKNYFALYASCLLLTTVAVVLDNAQPPRLRVVGFVGALLAQSLLVSAHSLDALVSSYAALAFVSILWLTRRLAPTPRLAVLVVVILILFLIPLLGSIEFSFADLLGYFGKNVTLTGRTQLWDNAQIAIAERPLLGVGYEAYWVAGNWRAEQLWMFAGLHGTTGYHFHNTYLQVMVDLGYIGLLLLLIPFVIMAGRMIGRILYSTPSPSQVFAMSILIFLVLRSPLEVDLLFPFQLPSVLIGLSWVYLQPKTASL